MNDDPLADRRRASEDDYFRKRDGRLIDEMLRRAESDAARKRMSERVGVVDEQRLRALEALGFSEDTVPLLHIAPLVQVAWIEGRVAGATTHIIQVARERGIEEGSPADRQMAVWLQSRPSDALFNEALNTIKALLERYPSSERDRYVHNLLEQCTAVAAGSGGLLGFGKISSAERQLLDHIRRVLDAREHTSDE